VYLLWRQIEEVDSLLLHLPIALILQNDAWGKVSAYLQRACCEFVAAWSVQKQKRQATRRESPTSTTTQPSHSVIREGESGQMSSINAILPSSQPDWSGFRLAHARALHQLSSLSMLVLRIYDFESSAVQVKPKSRYSNIFFEPPPPG
jgi:hypothetical protein